MTKVGKLFVCDRCGNKLDGWEIWEGKNLCPDCAKEYHMRLKGFWKEETK